MQSIISYKNRGHWGDSSYRGNTSGHVIKDLIQQFNPNPRKFIEVFSGGGTGKDVSKALNLNSLHLDLNNGWDALVDDIPYGADFVFSHPPYWNMINYQKYNNHHENDISNGLSYEDFIFQLDRINAKIYQSLVNGGRHATLVGDIRRQGKYYSMMKDMAWFGDLESHIIKAQHNYHSKSTQYAHNRFVPIVHEHILVFKKNQVWAVPLKRTATQTFDLRQFKNITWRDLIQGAIEWLGGKASLKEIYNVIHGSKKTLNNQNWQAKIRQTLQRHDNFLSYNGVWGLSI